MELHDVMRTTFAAREFTDDPVDDDTIYRILDNARFAPSGGNRQGWRVIVIRDRAKRAKLAGLIRPTMQRYMAQVAAGESPFNTIVPTKVDAARVAAANLPAGMIERMLDAPVLLLIAVDLSVVASFDSSLPRVGVISGASIYPFAWNILLAARNEGLGGTLTTFLAPAESEAQKLLGLPEHFAVAALLPIGKPVRQLTKLKRKPVEEFAVIEHYGGQALTRSAKSS